MNIVELKRSSPLITAVSLIDVGETRITCVTLGETFQTVSRVETVWQSVRLFPRLPKSRNISPKIYVPPYRNR